MARRPSYIGRWKPEPKWHDPDAPCQNKTSGNTCMCRPKCKVCGWGPHMAVHLKKPDGKPFDHQYIPKEQP